MEFKCPKCGSNDVKFQPENQYCYCEYCGSKIEIESLEIKKEMPQKQEVEYDEYICNSCGARLVADENTVMTFCVYCGNQQILKERMKGSFKPKGIIPFKVSKDEFINIYNSYLDNKSYREEFRNDIKILELKGVYIPAYIYEMEVDVYDRGKLVYENSKTREEKPYEIRFQFEVVSMQDASSYYDDKLIAAIEPFDLKEIVEYQPGFLSGFLADRGNITAKVMSKKTEERIKKDIDKEIYTELNKQFYGRSINEMKSYYKKDGSYIKKSQGLGEIVVESGIIEGGERYINIKNKCNKYVLLPVWFVNTMYKGKKYWIAVNGQTSKVDSFLPPDRIGIFKDLMVPILVAVIVIMFVSLFISSGLNKMVYHGVPQPLKFSSFAGIIGSLYFWGLIIYISYNIYRDRLFRDKYYPKQFYELEFKNKKYLVFKNYRKKEYIKAFGSKELKNKKKIKIFHDGISSDYTRWEDEIK